MKAITTKFYDIIEARFNEWCATHNEKPTTKALLLFLTQKKIITGREIKIAVIVDQVNEISQKCNVSKTNAIRTVEAIYEVPESTCFYILDKHQLRHK